MRCIVELKYGIGETIIRGSYLAPELLNPQSGYLKIDTCLLHLVSHDL